ncbi:MAG: hypothetical protein K6F21_06880 [Bacteroidales bacterium]|nr:hypothetical protein [Bacteroidales bacterium]
MKKVLLILCAFAALCSCSKESKPQQENGFPINIRVTRSDDFGGSKATVKTGWADGDMIYLFFKDLDSSDKFLELAYDGSMRKWTALPQNGLEISDLEDAEAKEMTAVFLPYGNGASIRMSGDQRIFTKGDEDLEYNGYFLMAEDVNYTVSEGELDADLVLTAPILTGGDKLIHFDVSGFTSGNHYELYQDHVKRLVVLGVDIDGEVLTTVNDKGKAIRGYEDNTSGSTPILSFSGILDASVVGTPADYQFSVNDVTDCVLYTRDAGERTISQNKYIGLGNITSPYVWKTMEYADLGMHDENGKRLMWARRNVGATAERGEGSYGLYFAFGSTRGYALLGEPYNYTGIEDDHDFYESRSMDYELDDTCWPPRLKPEYDAAHVNLKGLWRMPVIDEFTSLLAKTEGFGDNGERDVDLGTDEGGMPFISKINGAELFLPTAGSLCHGNGHEYTFMGSSGTYWSATPGVHESGYTFIFTHRDCNEREEEYYYGTPIRAVFSID